MIDNSFQTREDIANRALTHLGQGTISDITATGKKPEAMLEAYDKMRQAELRRNVWRFSIRNSVIRPIDIDTMSYTPPAYVSATTYRIGDIVSYAFNGISRYWMSTADSNVGNAPGTVGAPWRDFFASLYVTLHADTTSYWPGDMVYIAPGDGTYAVYLALRYTSDTPSTVQTWDEDTTYFTNQVVKGSDLNLYSSDVDLNKGNDPTGGSPWSAAASGTSLDWVQLSGTLARPQIIYPVGAGPRSQATTRNVYPLPHGYMRQAAPDPKAGSVSLLGASTSRIRDDWIFEGRYMVTRDVSPIPFRFAADITDVTQMDAMFCEGLAARMAMETCETLTQSTEKLRNIAGDYQKFMGEARIVNGIETGIEEPPEDDYITCRR